MPDDVKIIHWPDPRLLKMSRPADSFDGALRELAERMLVLMREARGVGLAAPQVGVNLRLFVIGPTGKPEDERIYVNPEIVDAVGDQEGEEGCLSLPGITASIVRANGIILRGQDIEGKPLEEQAEGYVARIWQHEYDHLNGKLLMDRMGAVSKLTSRKRLRELEADWLEAHPQAALAGKGKRR